MDFKDQVVLITGAAGGIGAKTAEEFAKKGAKLSLVDLNLDELEKLKLKLNLSDEKVLIKKCDVSSEDEVASYVKDTIKKFGTIDIFVNNAGVEGEVAPINLTEAKNLDFVIDINIKGAYYGLKHVLPIMYENKKGSIINTASVAGFIGSPGLAPYVASKHALLGLTKTAALEAAPYNVRVNAICPGPVDNNMMRNIERKASPDAPSAVKDGFVAMLPMGRYANNLDVANNILFLASDMSNYLTGVAHRIDGGMGAK